MEFQNDRRFYVTLDEEKKKLKQCVLKLSRWQDSIKCSRVESDVKVEYFIETKNN
jgi:hypothetical protein